MRLCSFLLLFLIAFSTVIAVKLPLYKLPQASKRALTLGGSRVSLYYTDIKIGDQVQRVAVDTGSSALYVPTPQCVDMTHSRECPHVYPYYDPEKSSTASFQTCFNKCSFCRKGICVIGTEYKDGSFARAEAVSDIITIGNISTRAYFGAIYEMDGKFSNDLHIDGLWGMGFASQAQVTPVFDSFVQQGIQNMFSMCFNDEGGVLLLGEVDSSLQLGSTKWAKIIDTTYYTINTTKMEVFSQTVNVKMPNAIVDSGTTLLILSTPVYNALKAAIQQNCFLPAVGCGNDQPSVWDIETCWPFSSTDIAQYPNIAFSFEDPSGNVIKVDLPPHAYFIQTQSDTGKPCVVLGIQPTTEDLVRSQRHTFMRAFYTIFDRQNMRVGFAPVNSATCTGGLPVLPQVPTAEVKLTNWVVVGVVIAIVLIVVVVIAVLLAVYFFNKKRNEMFVK